MNCMKCGRDIEEGQVFCSSCLEVMAKYPVKPGIAIQLPNKKDHSPVKKAASKRKQPPAPEEQIRKLKKRIRGLVLLWLVTLVLLAAAVYPTLMYFTGNQMRLPGQNYTTVTSTESATP